MYMKIIQGSGFGKLSQCFYAVIIKTEMCSAECPK